MSDEFVILGATGGQGGAVARELLRTGHRVRAVVRNPESTRSRELVEAGAQLAVADLTKVDQLAEAFADTAGVFAVTTPFKDGEDAELAQGDAILTAATRSEVRHLVFSSVAASAAFTGVPHFDTKHRIEVALQETSLRYTILGCTYFYDNMMGDRDAIDQGVLMMPIPTDAQLQQMSRDDLGQFVTSVFDAPDDFGGQRISLASDSVTPTQMAQTLTEVLGHRVQAESYDPDRIDNVDMRAMWKYYADHRSFVDIDDLHSRYPSIAWTSFAQWAQGALG